METSGTARGCNRAPSQAAFLAALTCTGSLLFVLLMAASESLRHAGLTLIDFSGILEKQLTDSLRSYVRAGRRPIRRRTSYLSNCARLSAADPALAHYIEKSCRLAEATAWKAPEPGARGRRVLTSAAIVANKL